MKCYEIDWRENKNAWKRKCDWKDANKILRKLRRHFKVPWDCDGKSAYFVNNRKGSASSVSNRINLPKQNISLGLMAHEIAHLVQHKRYNNRGHNKKFMRALKIVNGYIIKQHYYDSLVEWNIKSQANEREFRIPYRINLFTGELE